MRVQNTRCAITLKDLSKIEKQHIFKKITNAGFVRGYEICTLLKYFESAEGSLRWPVSREPVSSVELRRIEKQMCVPRTHMLTSKLGNIWHDVFLLTLLTSINSLIEEINLDISTKSTDYIEGEDDRLSSFLASMLYLFVTNKTKFRTLKNKVKRTLNTSNARAASFKHICSMLESMSDLFAMHELVLAWEGRNVVPIIISFENQVQTRLLG